MQLSFSDSRLAGPIDDLRGLSAAEAAERIDRFGPNAIADAPRTGWREVLRDTVRDPMIWFLLGTASLFAALGDYVEAAILATALLPIAGMDAWLHRRTQASTEGLGERLASRAQVLRDDAWVDLPAIDLVPGDLALVRAGEAFPADGVLVGGEGLQVDESSLTGESMPVRKQLLDASRAQDGEWQLDAIGCGLAGTRLLTGKAHLRVIHTGGDSMYGQIARSARLGSQERTPLQSSIGSLVRALLVVAGLLCIALALIRYLQGHGPIDALLSAVTLAVAALPEEFPIVFSFFLGVGVFRLARRQALVRRAVVVENIGRITCICTDKTGTLTEGRLQLTHALAAEGCDEAEVAAVAASAARRDSGDPMDFAIFEHTTRPIAAERIETYPFTEDRRREVAILRFTDGSLGAALKGAPETVIAMCALDEAARDRWLEATQAYAAGGHKVIACARRSLESWAGGEPDRGYGFAGLLAFEDPIRAGVADAVAQAQAGGIRVIMMTGDHPLTAMAIAKEIGIAATDVIARAVPAQKLERVRSLQQQGEIVAVTGDGVNDVPALQGADVGIAMGERGTRSAREAAAIVLLDDNFRTIVSAISEGRQLFLNLKLAFAYLLMVHMPLVATAALVPLAGFPLLYLPTHIVWLELIIHPTALLVFQQAASGDGLTAARKRPPSRFFDAREWAVIALVGLLVSLLVVLGYDHSLGLEVDIDHARSMAMLALIVAGAVITLALGGLRNRSAWLAVLLAFGSAILAVQVVPLAALLHLNPLHASDWALATVGGMLAAAPAALIPMLQRMDRHHKC